jgi:hypothetical protein
VAQSHRKQDGKMENMYPDGFEFTNDDPDVMMRMINEDGKELTFITAPSEGFADKESIEPIVTGWDGQIIVAFNGDLVEQMVRDSIDKNGENYGDLLASFLPISKILQVGMKAANDYLEENKI